VELLRLGLSAAPSRIHHSPTRTDGHERKAPPLRNPPRQDRCQFCAAIAADLPVASSERPPGPRFGDSRRSELHLGADLCALSTTSLGSNQARHWTRRHRRGHVAQRARTLRGAFWRADDRCGLERAEYPPRCRNHRLYTAAWRGQGPDHRLRIGADDRPGLKEGGAPYLGHRHRRPTGTQSRAPRRPSLRGSVGPRAPRAIQKVSSIIIVGLI
jgi:hypothetical protein